MGLREVHVVVPGRRGFASDPTHLTFVDRDMLSDARLVDETDLAAPQLHHFPVDVEALGNRFAYHELHARFVRRPTRG